MVKLFDVVCPECKGKFHCHWEDLRHKEHKLNCPFCGISFHQDESPRIIE